MATLQMGLTLKIVWRLQELIPNTMGILPRVNFSRCSAYLCFQDSSHMTIFTYKILNDSIIHYHYRHTLSVYFFPKAHLFTKQLKSRQPLLNKRPALVLNQENSYDPVQSSTSFLLLTQHEEKKQHIIIIFITCTLMSFL